MNNDLNLEKSLQNKIKEVLLKEWDPIGIQGMPEAQDEYDAYVFSIYKLLISQKAECEIFNYLWWAQEENIGLICDKQRTLSTAYKLSKL